jgi:hypothetical protein
MAGVLKKNYVEKVVDIFPLKMIVWNVIKLTWSVQNLTVDRV